MTRARDLANLGNPSVISADSDNKVGIGSTQPAAKLDVRGDVDVSQGLSVTGVVTVTGAIDANSTSNFADVVTVSDTTQSSSKDSGSVVVEGGAGIEKNLFVGGGAQVSGLTTVADFKATGNFPVTPDSGTGIGATVGKGDSGITTYYGDGSNLDGVTGGGGLGTAISYDVAGTTSPFSYIDREVNVTENMDLTNTNAGLNSSIIVSVIPQVTVLNGIAVTVGTGKTMVIDILQIADI